VGTLIRPTPVTDRQQLITRVVGWRSGTAASVEPVPVTPADPPIVQWSASHGPVDDRTPAGGAALDETSARAAAIGELLERYAAASCPLRVVDRGEIDPAERVLDHGDFSLHNNEQRSAPDFPNSDSYRRTELTRVHSLLDNIPAWVPANLISNDPDFGHLATSNGLAAGPTTCTALLRAVQELIERDALMITWLHRIGARRVPAPDAVRRMADPIGADVTVFDITPAYSSHPVAAVAGTARLAGRPRNSFGLACRATFADAATKAALEWAQGVSFAGVNTAADGPDAATFAPEQVNDFDDHAIFYTRRPDLWHRLPLWSGPVAEQPGTEPLDPDPRTDHDQPADHDQLAALVRRLADRRIELFYRDLTLPDLAACGVRAVRVVSPQLVPIHHDHRWPHLGGTAEDLALRYPWATSPGFPSRDPHPLG
jgi:ribosomal protein S12 methylthiotransferase accessory factor